MRARAGIHAEEVSAAAGAGKAAGGQRRVRAVRVELPRAVDRGMVARLARAARRVRDLPDAQGAQGLKKSAMATMALMLSRKEKINSRQQSPAAAGPWHGLQKF